MFKNQIDWIPLTTGSIRPTQGRTLAIAQVSGGSQSFNAVNSIRILGRWRMFTIPNQSSIPKAYTQFPDEGHPNDQRLNPGGNRELFAGRFSERTERRTKLRNKPDSVSKGRQSRHWNQAGRDESQRQWVFLVPFSCYLLLRRTACIC